MKRIAALYGYEKVGRSHRYQHCEKWIRTSYHNGIHPWYRARVLREKAYTGKDRNTNVVYLAMEPNLNVETPQPGMPLGAGDLAQALA